MSIKNLKRFELFRKFFHVQKIIKQTFYENFKYTYG